MSFNVPLLLHSPSWSQIQRKWCSCPDWKQQRQYCQRTVDPLRTWWISKFWSVRPMNLSTPSVPWRIQIQINWLRSVTVDLLGVKLRDSLPAKTANYWRQINITLYRNFGSYCRSKFYVAGIGIFDLFAPVTLIWTRLPAYANLIHINPSRYLYINELPTSRLSQVIIWQIYQYIHTDRQTVLKLYTTLLRRWSKNFLQPLTMAHLRQYKIIYM